MVTSIPASVDSGRLLVQDATERNEEEKQKREE